MKARWKLAAALLAGSLIAMGTVNVKYTDKGASNPILPGYFADPSVVVEGGKFYIYATFDPWGFDHLACWESSDFKNWTLRELNWPTKRACTSPTSKGSMVWAPSVVKRGDKFWMYVSVGSEVWVGVADHPLGPWKNALGDKPMIDVNFNTQYHMIDAEAFIDDDGEAYLYWGSGWNYVNGHCFAAKLNPDMVSFATTPIDVTPANYFEGPIILKRNGWYYLLSSNGKVGEHSYRVHVARSKSPLGPFEDNPAGVLLGTSQEDNLSGPGHNGLLRWEGEDYIVYHRNTWGRTGAYRQVCVDKIAWDDASGWPKRVVGTHNGVDALWAKMGSTQPRQSGLMAGAKARASSVAGEAFAAECVLDDNYATRWAPAEGGRESWIELELAKGTDHAVSHLRLEYPSRPTRLKLETSADGKTWTLAADHTERGVHGSPIETRLPDGTRFLRATFAPGNEKDPASVIEWNVASDNR